MAHRRKKGSGTVRLRADGRWEARFIISYSNDGAPQYKSVFAPTKNECIRKMQQYQSEHGPPPEKLASNMAFGNWLEHWFEFYAKPKIRESTQASYNNTITNHIMKDEISKKPLNQIKQSDLEQFYKRQKKHGGAHISNMNGPLSDRCIRMIHNICRQALEVAKRRKLLHINPAVGCQIPPKHAREMAILSREEIQRFFIQAKYDGVYEIFLLELSTGLRRGELLALQWADLNFRTGELKISRQWHRVNNKTIITQLKTKASRRTIILPDAVLRVLHDYKQTTSSRWMFPSPHYDDRPRDPSATYKILKRTLERAECKDIRFHDLRHTFATMALQNGMDIKTLSVIIGHVSAATTLDVYTHITDDMQKNAAVCIERSIAGNPNATQTDAPSPPMNSPNKKVSFTPKKSRIRKPGTGCITQINDHLWEGRYSPTWIDGTRRPKNIYAHSHEECEKKLAELIAEMQAELAALRTQHGASQ